MYNFWETIKLLVVKTDFSKPYQQQITDSVYFYIFNFLKDRIAF